MYVSLISRESVKVFDSLQELSTQDAYGTVLGRMVCFYLRIIRLEDDDESNDDILRWRTKYPLAERIVSQLERLNDLLESYIPEEENLEFNEAFHQTIYKMFCWIESKTLLEEGFCPVQRFLMAICLRKDGTGFIHVRDITPMIAKFMYCIRATIFAQLMSPGNDDVALEEDLAGHQIYVKDLFQSPFGLLLENMHLASTIIGMSNVMPVIGWIGEEYKSLTIHGKRVDLSGFQSFCQKLLKSLQRKFNHEIKMGLPGLKDFDWKKFDPQDDLSSVKGGYSFIVKGFGDRRQDLLNQFLSNKATNKYFTNGRNGDRVLWNAKNCKAWLKKCKEFQEGLSVEVHFLGGQADRSTEAVTLRICNTADEQRGVLWDNDMIMLLGQYAKTRSITGLSRPIPR